MHTFNWFLLGELALLLHNALDPSPIFHTHSQPIEPILYGWLPWRGSNVCLPDCAPEQRRVSSEALRTATLSEKVTLILTPCQRHNGFTSRNSSSGRCKCRIFERACYIHLNYKLVHFVLPPYGLPFEKPVQTFELYTAAVSHCGYVTVTYSYIFFFPSP